MKNINKIIDHLGGWKNALKLVKPSSSTLTMMIIVLVLVVFFPENEWGFADEKKSQETQQSLLKNTTKETETVTITPKPQETVNTPVQEEPVSTPKQEEIEGSPNNNDNMTENNTDNTVNDNSRDQVNNYPDNAGNNDLNSNSNNQKNNKIEKDLNKIGLSREMTPSDLNSLKKDNNDIEIKPESDGVTVIKDSIKYFYKNGSGNKLIFSSKN